MVMKTSTKDRIRGVVEILLIGILVLSGIGTGLASPDDFRENGPIVEWLGAQAALWFYGAVFLTEGIWLAYAKWAKKKVSHKYALFTIYITTLFTILLEVLLAPDQLYAAIDNAVIAAFAGWAWLQWKMKIDYIDPDEFKAQLRELSKEHNHEEGSYHRAVQEGPDPSRHEG